MDLHLLDRSDSIKPILVKLFDKEKIYALAKDENPAARSELTAIVSELLECELTVAESELVADVLIQLVGRAALDLRQSLAEHLCKRENIPLRLAIHMANDQIEVAGAMLEHSPVFNDLDLTYIINSKSSEYWQRIAMRAEISNELQKILVDTRDFPTAHALTENNDILLSGYAMGVLAQMSEQSDKLAEQLVVRNELPADLLEEIYRHAGDALKSMIKAKADITPKEIDHIVEEKIASINDSSCVQENCKEELNADEHSADHIMSIMNTLRAGNVSPFIRRFAEFTGLDKPVVQKALEQKSAKGLAIICKANEINKADFVSIFLLTNSLRNKGKMVGMSDMSCAVDYFNRIEEAEAKAIFHKMKAEISD